MADTQKRRDETPEELPLGDLHTIFRAKRDSIEELKNICYQLLSVADTLEVEKKQHVMDCHETVKSFLNEANSILYYEAHEVGSNRKNPIPAAKEAIEKIIAKLESLEQEQTIARYKIVSAASTVGNRIKHGFSLVFMGFFTGLNKSDELALAHKARDMINEIHSEFQKKQSN